MSRVIKFRAWVRNYLPHREPATMVHSDNFGSLSFFFSNFEGEPMMQFTGLHDVNGVEIYEGDIVKCHYISLMMPSLRSSEYEVKYEPSLGFMPIHDIFDYDGARTEGKDWEVIGNIYENPEQLK